MIKEIALEHLNRDNIGTTQNYTIRELSVAMVEEYNKNEEYYNLPAQADDLIAYKEAEICLDELSTRY